MKILKLTNAEFLTLKSALDTAEYVEQENLDQKIYYNYDKKVIKDQESLVDRIKGISNKLSILDK